ncbi:hypothetical protein CKO28_02760 [Rhodovibrio sodomensis]|uniref:Uncharacterized protein n=1 Tax=Rhodovibrio sodomensis TaxID=1088 RepID=A0ABS1DAC9_9PROT|nr:hypothetical protein [Rhodovibrio sodomensis]MBK1666964.1 hypothetical protein [Rhodovibrio sodomensis]
MDQNDRVRVRQANLAPRELALSISEQAETQLKGRILENAAETAKHLGCELADVTYMVVPNPTFVEDGRVLGGMIVDLEFSVNGEDVGGESVDGQFSGTLAADGTLTLTSVVAYTHGLH